MLVALLSSLLLAAPPAASPPRPPEAATAWLVDATESAGLVFEHQASHTEQHLYPETFGAGVALLDVDGDGDLDVLFLDSGPPPGSPRREVPRHALYLNESGRAGSLAFRAAEPPRVPGLTAMGACVGDVDGDGDADVHVTGLPSGRLLLNSGGRLAPAKPPLGVDDPGWSTSCAFLDHDRDGHLDLYAAHYVRWSAAEERECGGEVEGFLSYCPPDVYEPEPDRLYRGDGRGGFVDVTEAAGLPRNGKGLGVVAADFDGDGWTDVYVANDAVANHLLLGGPRGRFRDAALLSGTALAEDGQAQAGMGVDVGDVDGDGRLDLWVTNLDLETNSLYLALPASPRGPRFRDAVHASGLGRSTLMALGFGAVLADFDADGDVDAFAANGHVIPEIAIVRPDQEWAMVDQLFENVSTGGSPRLSDASARWPDAAEHRSVSRGLAVGDLDDDGDLDLLVTTNGGSARLLRNTTDPTRWLGLRLRATASAPGAPGALAELEAGGRRRIVPRRTGGSYLSASDERIVFGLGDAPSAHRAHVVTMRWTSGRCEAHGPLSEGRYHEVVEGSGAPCAPVASPTTR